MFGKKSSFERIISVDEVVFLVDGNGHKRRKISRENNIKIKY
jgi:hypothetical protein